MKKGVVSLIAVAALAAALTAPVLAASTATQDVAFQDTPELWNSRNYLAGPASAKNAIGATGTLRPAVVEGPPVTGGGEPQGIEGASRPAGTVVATGGSSANGGSTSSGGTKSPSTPYAAKLGFTLTPVPNMNNAWTAASKVAGADGLLYWPESAQQPYDIQRATNANTDVWRFETRDNELWSSANGGNDSRRAELDGAAGAKYGLGQDFWVSYWILFEPGAPLIATAGGNPGGGAAWNTVGQIHGSGSEQPVPASLNFLNETLSVVVQTDPGQTFRTVWKDSASTPRGKWRFVVAHFKISGTPADVCQFWIGGVQVVNYTGVIGSAKPDPSVYFKFGNYLGWQTDGIPPFAVWYGSVRQSTTSLLSLVTSPPRAPAPL